MLFTYPINQPKTVEEYITEGSPLVMFKNVETKIDLMCTYAEAYVPKFFGKEYEHCPVHMYRTYEVQIKHVDLFKIFLKNKKEIEKRVSIALIRYTHNKNIRDISEKNIKAVHSLYSINKIIIDSNGNMWIDFISTWDEPVTIQVIKNSKILSIDEMTNTVVGQVHGFIELCLF